MAGKPRKRALNAFWSVVLPAAVMAIGVNGYRISQYVLATEQLGSGGDRSWLSMLFTIVTVTTLLAAPIVGALVDAFGAVLLMVVGLLCMSGGLALTSLPPSFEAWLLGSVLSGAGYGVVNAAIISAVVLRTVVPHRQLAAMVVIMAAPLLTGAFGLMSSGLTGAQFPNKPDAFAMTLGVLEILFGMQGIFGLLKAFGWRAQVSIGALLVLLAWLVCRRTGPTSGYQNSNEKSEVFRNRTYWVLALCCLLSGSISFIDVHGPAFTVENGLPTAAVVSVLKAYNAGGLCGLLVVAFFGEARRKNMLASLAVLHGLTFAGFLLVPITAASLNALFFVQGAAAIPFLAVAFILTAKLHGMRWLGLLFGVLFSLHGAGHFVGSRGVGLLHDMAGSFSVAFLLAIVICVANAVMCLFIAEPKEIAEQKTA